MTNKVTEVTGETITDEQIRELPPKTVTARTRRFALAKRDVSLRLVVLARARCAKIWNARRGGES